MELNLIKCGSTDSTVNTGIADCAFTPAHIIGMILTPRNFIIPAANYLSPETLLEFLQIYTHEARVNRIFPLAAFKGLEADNTEAPTEYTFGYGDQETIREGKVNWSFRYSEGGICLHNNLRKFNGQQIGALFIDANGVLIGTRSGDDLKAVPLSKYYAPAWGASNGSEPTKLLINVSFDPKYVNEQIAFLDPDGEIDLTEVKGLLNVKLTSKLVAGDAVTTAKVSCGGTDLYELYADELAVVGAWKATGVNGVPIVISGVTKNDASKAWVIATAADFVAGDIIELQAPSVLTADPINVSGYEGLPATVTV